MKESIVNQGSPIKDTAEFKTFVNGYSLSQSNLMLGKGIGADAEPTPSPEVKEELANAYSLSKCHEKFEGKGDNINGYSLSKLGKGLS